MKINSNEMTLASDSTDIDYEELLSEGFFKSANTILFPNIYEFDSNSAATVRFLRSIGFSEEMIQLGIVHKEDILERGIDADVFDNIANAMEVDNFLSYQEAGYGNLMLKKVGDPALSHALFSNQTCPRSAGAYTVLGNYRGQALEPQYSNPVFSYSGNNGVVPETACSFENIKNEGFETEDLTGLFFPDEMMPEKWQNIGKPVVPILDFREKDDEYPAAGSAVILSPYGYMVSAAHVLVDDETQQLYEKSVVQFRDTSYPIREENILYLDHDTDLAIFVVPELEFEPDLPYATIAKSQPDPSDELMAVGYPATREAALGNLAYYSKKSLVDSARMYSTGGYKKDIVLDLEHSYYQMSNRIYYGQSGGAVFNSNGELVAINHAILSGFFSIASSVIPEETTHQDLQQVLAEVQAAQPQECSTEIYDETCPVE